ncbi:MAG TPA: polysaccharide deacetylase family protein [Candidatus Limnocylindria bacterium]|jgi:peptidoglycan-N-acetylglucosamine deacetylase|nr:polysaccharide deacetylase family protein [Candidatus Limnocylindria bacterium]
MKPLRVALTFDAEHPDRPTSPAVVDSILATLDRQSVRATFFLQGRWVESEPATAARICAAGHLVGNHSFYHARMPLLSEDGFVEDVREAARVIRETCGLDPAPWFRCPFGAGADHSRTQWLLAGLGYRDVGWHVEVEDWEPRHTGDDLARAVISKVEAHGDGAIVLLHSWPRSTGTGLGGMIGGLRQRGYDFVGVDELLDS